MTGHFFWLNICTKKYHKSRELKVKFKLKDTLGTRGIFSRLDRENGLVNGRTLLQSRRAFSPTLEKKSSSTQGSQKTDEDKK